MCSVAGAHTHVYTETPSGPGSLPFGSSEKDELQKSLRCDSRDSLLPEGQGKTGKISDKPIMSCNVTSE